MKKALLWLGPLACLTLAGLYAYAWFNRDPLVVAFRRIEVGMTLEDAEKAMGSTGTSGAIFLDFDPNAGTLTRLTHQTGWEHPICWFEVMHREGIVVEKKVEWKPGQMTLAEKVCDIVRDPSTLWRPRRGLNRSDI